MYTTEQTIIYQALMALENLQALNKTDLQFINSIDDPALLETCAAQLQRLAKELEPYRNNEVIGTYTALGMIAGIRKNKDLKTISHYKVRTRNGLTDWMTAEEFNDALNNQTVISAINC